MNKKRIFAIVVFIILGLFMYTFANPLNNDKDDNANQNNAGENANSNSPLANNDDNTQRNATRNARRAVNATPVVANTPAVVQDATPAVVPVVVPTENVSPAVKPTEEEKPAEEKPSIEPIVIDLTLFQINAVNELKQYRNSYEYSDDTKYNELIDDYSKKINDSESLSDINKNLADGKDAIDKLIGEDLNAYKEAAKKEIADYAEALDLTTDVTELLEGFNNDIDEATTKSAIDKIVEDAKKKLDEIKAAEIAKAKEDANKEIDEYKKEDETNLPEIVKVKEDAKEEIKNTDDIEKINIQTL